MTIFGRKDACARYRPALTDWVEHRVQGPSTPSAFDHLARCRRCERELTDIAQTIIALRRLAELTAAVEPPSDGWPDLRARLDASQRRARALVPLRVGRLLGSMLGPAIVAVLAMRVVVSAPIGTVWSDDGSSGRPASTRAARPMYDSGLRPLTKDIVTILASRAPAGGGDAIVARDRPLVDRSPRHPTRGPSRGVPIQIHRASLGHAVVDASQHIRVVCRRRARKEHRPRSKTNGT